MSFTPDPLQTLFLWALLFQHDGSAPYSAIRPALGPVKRGNRKLTGAQRRDELREHGLIEIAKGEKGAVVVTLSETGWGWAAEHLDAEVSPRSQAGGPILQAALTRVKTYLGSRGGALADLFIESEPESEFTPAEPIETRIRQAYFVLSDGRPNARIRVADLIGALADVEPATVQDILLQMSRARSLLLVPGENPRELTQEDHRHAIALAGVPNHFVRME